MKRQIALSGEMAVKVVRTDRKTHCQMYEPAPLLGYMHFGVILPDYTASYILQEKRIFLTTVTKILKCPLTLILLTWRI